MTKTTITLELEASSDLEAATAKKALENMLSKLKAQGVIKLNDIYEKDFMIKTAVNKKLGIKS